MRAEARPTTSYCTAKVDSLGCTPVIAWAGSPSSTPGTNFTITASQALNNKSGLFFYGLAGEQAASFQGGTLCVKPPLRRTGASNSAGNPPPNDCSGQCVLDFSARITSSVDPALVAGATVDGQFSARDPGFSPPNGTSLTNAIRLVIE